MANMTDEEAEYWDEYYTNHTPKLGVNGTGFLSMRELRVIGLDQLSENYLLTKAQATKQSPGQLINALIRKELSSAAEYDIPRTPEKTSAFGCLHRFANPAKMAEERGAWERAVVEKYEENRR
jgi:hypothetical protein